MKASMIKTQIENSKDPFMIFQLELLNSLEEIEQITDNVENILTLGEIMSIENNVISADVSKTKDYIIINQSFIEQFEQLMIKCGFEMQMTDLTTQIWDSNDIEEFVKLFEGKNEKVDEILKVVAESQFTVNDVLDKISEKGIDSLNELNKYILEKESR
jgi:hypothetical protein